ncbi:MAG TPA: molybdopterin-binding/glycosyltransferase family 2 protein [Rhizomicrobium sp.]|nr:molybdopterin-binding/glycosyltransferase family 2 protein [Rhizomicrobium sp.]
MKFAKVSLQHAEGAILAHSLRAGERRFKKGHLLAPGDLMQLLECGIREAVVAELESGDVREDEAAARIAEALAGEDVRVGAAFTGRANLYATAEGLAMLDPACVNALNALDEAITVATLPPFARVAPRQMMATVKIIPFAAPVSAVEKAEALARRSPVRVAAFRPRMVALILTTLPGTRPALLDKTRRAIAHRIAQIGSRLVFEREVAHDIDALSPVLAEAAKTADLILVFGASAISDRRDVVPAAIEQAGGTIERFGMPVDPGNLLLLGELGAADVIGLPGCARSPKLNGFDFVLWRLAAGLPVSSADIAAMGVGGLLMEIPVRPQPRDEPAMPRAPKIGAVVLAAGASSRLGANKLLTEIDGKPLVRRVVEAALASGAAPVVVVTGNEAERVQTALAGCDVHLMNNPDFSSGLSSSLRCGLKALPEDCDSAIIVLGDMPAVTSALIDRLIAAFDPAEDRAICVATHGGKRGNPVLFARRFFAEIEAIEGDVGARGLIGAYPELVYEVEAGSDAPLIDIDTPEDLAAYRPGRP